MQCWGRRDLSRKSYVYFWADGIHCQARLEESSQCFLVIIAADETGRKELVGIWDGYRESGQSWKELLLDLKRRGLKIGPRLAVGDGALGFWKALAQVYGRNEGAALLGPQDGPAQHWGHRTFPARLLR